MRVVGVMYVKGRLFYEFQDYSGGPKFKLGLPHFNAQQEVFEFRRQMRLVENLKLYCIVRWQFGVVG